MPRKKKIVNDDSNSTEICYAVSIPKPDENSLNNLKALIKGKEKIIMHAFGVEKLPIDETGDTLTFEWLPPDSTQEEIHALMVLVSKMAELSKNLKRVNLKEKDVENEKYAFRCFLLRLNMNGKEYKRDRAILLSRLQGSSAFKCKGGDKDAN